MTLLHGGNSPAAGRSYLSVGPEAETAAAAETAVTTTAAGTGSRGVTAMHPTPTHHPPPTTLPRPGWNSWRPPARAWLSCRHGLAKEGRQHVIAEIWNVDLKPNAQAF